MNKEIKEGGVELLDVVRPLWEELNVLHAERSTFFSEDYKAFTFADRKKMLQEKAKKGKLRVSIWTGKEGLICGYYIASIDGYEGEIDSIYVRKERRKLGIGAALMKDCLEWLKKNGSERIKVVVAYGNEDVFGFYKKFELFPRATTLTTLHWHTGRRPN
jgi:ribosomal protein S18 acetylase RimI-like enzyme